MAQEIKTVALAGSWATGSLGSKILQALVDHGRFNVTALVRKQRDELPSGVKVIVADFDSVASLTEALKDQDALVDATSPDPTLSLRLIDAAVAAGVYRIIPAEFGSDPENPKARSLPSFVAKQEAYKHIKKLADEKKITWTAVSNHAFLDWGLHTSFLNIDLAKKKVDYFNDGTHPFPWTLLSSVGTAVANILAKPEQTNNRVCRIYNILKSQKEVADLAKEALGSDGWQKQELDAQKVFEEAMSEVAVGKITFQVIGDLVRYSLTTPGYCLEGKKDDNELLGVPALNNDQIRQIIKEVAAELNAA